MNIKKMIATSITLTLLASSSVFASFWSPLTDTVNSGIINTKILADHSLSMVDIDATVVDGVAIYSGEINSKAQEETLIRIAQSVSGIKRVDTTKLKLKIAPAPQKPTALQKNTTS